MIVRFGNASIVREVREETFDDHGVQLTETRRIVSVPGQSITTYGPPDEWTLFQVLESFVATDGAWNAHSDQPPVWVECDQSVVVAQAFAEHYGCPVGRPDGWEISDHLRSGLPPNSEPLVPDDDDADDDEGPAQ